jgi:hypothetical protein
MCAAELLCALNVKRGIKHCFNNASGIDRKDLIQYKENNTNNRVSFVTTYHPDLSNLSTIVRERWTTIQQHPDVLKAINCTFQEVDNIFCLAVGITYMMNSSPVCVLLNFCVH